MVEEMLMLTSARVCFPSIKLVALRVEEVSTAICSLSEPVATQLELKLAGVKIIIIIIIVISAYFTHKIVTIYVNYIYKIILKFIENCQIDFLTIGYDRLKNLDSLKI